MKPSFTRGFRLHLPGGRHLDGAEFPSSRVYVLDDPEYGFATVATSLEHLLPSYHGARVEWPPVADQGTDAEPDPDAALHRSAEEDVTRVIDLYEQWVKAGPPPLGTSTSRWWDARLAELHNAIRPPADGAQQDGPQA
ncbi:hypothetical protein [Streptomyces sp. NPDC087437]|uniref:hypothetical protein n=1 Tax=Streptomyces sp. NPDC087437 TaxID=3365789 RepID=UPI00381D6D2B